MCCVLEGVCAALYVEVELCLLEVLKGMRRLLLCMLEAVEGGLNLLEELEETLSILEGYGGAGGICCVLLCMLEARRR